MTITQKARRLLCVVLAALQVFLYTPAHAWETGSEEVAESIEEDQQVAEPELEEPQEELSSTAPASDSEEPPSPDEAVVGTSVLQETDIAPEASVSTGAATYRIPIRVVPGRSLTPEITLTYNSFRMNSWVGVGWDLSMGAIQRSTKWGAANYGGTDFVVITPDSNFELVPRSATDWPACPECYSSKIEGSFSRYERVFGNRNGTIDPSPVDGSWIVTSTDGTKYFYGTSPQSRQENGYGTFKWLMERVEDPSGNFMRFTYKSNLGEVYLSRIDYTMNPAQGASNYVLFITEARNDAPELYTTLTKVQTAQRLKTIKVFETANTGTSRLVSRYELTYESSPTSNRSLLTSVTRYDSDGNSLPPITLNWTQGNRNSEAKTLNGTLQSASLPMRWGYTQWLADFNGDGKDDYMRISANCPVTDGIPGDKCFVSDVGSSAYNKPLLHDIFQMADINLDGRVDLIMGDYNGTDGSPWSYVSVMTADSSGGFDTERLVGVREGAVSPRGYGFRVADVNGDGLPDIIDAIGPAHATAIEAFINKTDKDGVKFSQTPIRQPLRYALAYSNTTFHVADVNGDGKADIVYEDGNSYIRVMISDGERFTEEAEPWGRIMEPYFTRPGVNPWVLYAMPFQMADVNGDGLPDIVYASSRGADNIRVLLNTGTRFKADTSFGTRRDHMSTFSYDGDSIDQVFPIGFLTLDLNGDWMADFVYISADTGSARALLSSGSRFTSETTWAPAGAGRMTAGDYDGDGISDMAWTVPNLSGSGGGTGFLIRGSNRPANGQTPFPDLLAGVGNGIGGSYHIKYKPSSAYKNKYLPFTVQTVASIAVNDGYQTFKTTYDYEGALYDPRERELRGFEKVEKTLPDLTKITTWFYQDRVRKGLIARQETVDEEGKLYRGLENTYTIRALGAASFPYLSAKKELIYDGAPNPLLVESTFSYDGYGNLTRKATTDPVTGKTRVDKATYYHGDDTWMHSLPRVNYSFEGTGMTSDPAASANCLGGEDLDKPWLQKTCYEYKNATNLLRSKQYWFKEGNSPVAFYSYDQNFGNLTSIYDPNGNPPTTIEYDEQTQSFPWIITNPKGQQTVKKYDYRFGRLKLDKDPNGNFTTYDYDGFGRLTMVRGPYDQLSDPVGANSIHGTVSYKYLDFGTLNGRPSDQRITTIATVTPGTSKNVWKTSYFDGLGRVIKTVVMGPEGKNICTVMKYDFRGNLVRKSLPYFQESQPEGYTRYEYDCLGRQTKQTNPDDTVLTSSYMKGWTHIIDANGHKKSEQRDTFKNLVQVVQYKGTEGSVPFTVYARTNYEYDILGNLRRIIDAATPANVTTIGYNTLSQRKAMNDPNMGYWTYIYDANGNLRIQKDARGCKTVCAYDELNRIKRKEFRNGDIVSSISYTYDDDVTWPNVTPFIGKLSSVTDNSGTVIYEYDKRGWITKTIKDVDGVAGNNYVTETAHDNLGRITSITYPKGTGTVRYRYDGIVLAFLDSGSPITDDGKTEYAKFTNYNAMGQVGKVTYANGVSTAFRYEPLTNRLSHLLTASSTATIQDFEYLYDNMGNVTLLTDHLAPSWSMAYKYDEMNRLERADRGAEAPQSYVYEKTGNIKNTTLVGAYGYNGPQPYAVTSAGNGNTYHYDQNGNMDRRLGMNIVYDVANRPIQIGGKLSFVYDHQGRRVKKTPLARPTEETIYIGKLFETTSGVHTTHIFAGDMRIATKKPNKLYFHHTDHLGSMSSVTDLSGTRKEVARFEPFGTTRKDEGTLDLPYKFTGQELDEETGLYYYGARYYDATLGRFITPDPLLQAYFDPPSFDRLPDHLYASTAPPIHIDKTGHYSLKNPLILKTMNSPPGRLRSVELDGLSEIMIWNHGSNIASMVDIVWVPGDILNGYAYVRNNPVNLVDPLGLSDCGISDGNYGDSGSTDSSGTEGGSSDSPEPSVSNLDNNNNKDRNSLSLTSKEADSPAPTKQNVAVESDSLRTTIIASAVGAIVGALKGAYGGWPGAVRGAAEGALLGGIGAQAKSALDGQMSPNRAPVDRDISKTNPENSPFGYEHGWPGI